MPELTNLLDINGAVDTDRVPLIRPGALAPNDLSVAELRAAMLRTSNFNAAYLAWFATLPTALPATPGVAWNNGGTVAVS